MRTNYFPDMIENLRTQEHILLYEQMPAITAAEENAVVKFLQQAYETESTDYPYHPPDYDATAALWGAKTIYITAQLILYRQNKPAELAQLLPAYTGERTAGAILSADLCLRFLPAMLNKLQLIDSEDPLIEVLESFLTTWHYSDVGRKLQPGATDLTPVENNACLMALYTGRIIQHKNTRLALNPVFKNSVVAAMGMFAPVFWNDLKLNEIPV